MYEVGSDYVFEMIAAEKKRQDEDLELIASENYVSKDVMTAVGSVLTNKYAEGYPGHRYYGGCQCVDGVEAFARARAEKVFEAEHANVQPHSGSQANMAAYSALLNVGDKIFSSSLNSGGHLTHASPVSFVTKLYKVDTYDVDHRGRYDMDEIRKKAIEFRPKLIVAGASAYPRTIYFDQFKEIADEVGAYLMVDMAHIAGLVAGGCHPSPIPYADIVTSTCHKTLRGPRGGLILCKDKHSKQVDSAVFPRNQGGPLEHVIAGKAICFCEADTDAFKQYAKQICTNARVLGVELYERGIDLVTGGTDNHLLLIDTRNLDITGKEAEEMLADAGITVNKNMIPFDPQKPSITSGIRIGTAAMTTRGMKWDEMAFVAKAIATVLQKKADPFEVRKQVHELTKAFPIPEKMC